MGVTEQLELGEQRHQDLVEAREAHIGLELDAAGPQHTGSVRACHPCRGIEEQRLAHARLANEQQGGAARASRLEERFDEREVDSPSHRVVGAERRGRGDGQLCRCTPPSDAVFARYATVQSFDRSRVVIASATIHAVISK